MQNQQDYFEIHGLVPAPKGRGLSTSRSGVSKAPPKPHKPRAVPQGCSLYVEPAKPVLSPAMTKKATNSFQSNPKHRSLIRAVLNKEASDRQKAADYQDTLQSFPNGEQPEVDCYLYATQAVKKHERGPEKSQPRSRVSIVKQLLITANAKRRALSTVKVT